MAHPPWPDQLAGSRLYRKRLGCETGDPPVGHFCHLPPVLRHHRGTFGQRPGKPLLRPGSTLPHHGRICARPGFACQRITEQKVWWTWRKALPTRWIVERSIPRPRTEVCSGQGRQNIPTQYVHLLEALRSPTSDDCL